MATNPYIRSVCAVCLFLVTTWSRGETTVFGKIHISIDAINTGLGNHLALSSNSSSLGVKGREDLTDWAAAVWRLESDMDVTGERGTLNARARYAGIATKLGSVTAGIHETPWKSLGRKYDIQEDSIFDIRTLVGRDEYFSMDRDAVNSIVYKTPAHEGMQFEALQSVGETKNADGSDTLRLSSASFTLKNEMATLSIAYEAQALFKSEAIRAATTINFAAFKLAGFFERTQSSVYPPLDHDAWSANLVIRLPYGINLFTQGSAVMTVGSMVPFAALASGGVSYVPVKSVAVYLSGGQLINGAAYGYGLDNDGHGERYAVTALGGDPIAVSCGLVLKFN